jgi:hypothetical protein
VVSVFIQLLKKKKKTKVGPSFLHLKAQKKVAMSNGSEGGVEKIPEHLEAG